MTERQQLDRAKIEKAFRIMGQYLLDRKTLGEIAIYGGSAAFFSLIGERPPSFPELSPNLGDERGQAAAA